MNSLNNTINEAIWNQLGASIDMLENAITMCPDEHWDTKAQFWYHAYHCIFWTDYYLTIDPDKFTPQAPYTLTEFDPAGVLPDRTYTKGEMLSYLQFCREKLHTLIPKLSEETLNKRWVNPYKNYPFVEILLYNMRHIQHHAAQLNLLLRQIINDAPIWVSQAKLIDK